MRPPVRVTPKPLYWAGGDLEWFAASGREVLGTADSVRRAENPSLRAASCCSVDVVNGGDGVRLTSFWRTSPTR